MLISTWSMTAADPASKKLLYHAGAFNLLAAMAVLLIGHLAPFLVGLEVSHASQLLYVDLSAWLVVCLGLGYALGGYDLQRFWPFIALGVMAKIGVVLLINAYFMAGLTGWLVVLLSLGDLIYTVLFVRLLRAHMVV